MKYVINKDNLTNLITSGYLYKSGYTKNVNNIVKTINKYPVNDYLIVRKMKDNEIRPVILSLNSENPIYNSKPMSGVKYFDMKLNYINKSNKHYSVEVDYDS